MIAWSRQSALRLAMLAAIAVMIVLLWDYRSWFEPQAIRLRLANHYWAPLAFLLAHVLIGMSVVIPRTVMGIAAGLLFGLWWGLLLTVAGSMLGAWAAFGLVRLYRSQDLKLRFIGQLPAMDRMKPFLARLDRAGWRGVWAMRLLPLPHSPLNYAFGMTSIGWGPYSIGTLLGTVPSTIVVVAIGAAGGSALTGRATDWIVPLALGVVGLAISLLFRP